MILHKLESADAAYLAQIHGPAREGGHGDVKVESSKITKKPSYHRWEMGLHLDPHDNVYRHLYVGVRDPNLCI